MKRHEHMLKIAANSEVSVLLQGESGAGKEVAARYIHNNGVRSQGPFVALNCGAIANNLAESILEGSRKGSFTGATTDQMGVVRAAHRGTLFLDEIGEMPLNLQCKLLRILQERSVFPLGARQPEPVDFRLICATNRDLKKEVLEKRFREDLFFRLNVLPIRVPPLRERTDFADIARDLWREACSSLGCDREQTSLSDEEIRRLGTECWPGNIRQLKNVLQRYALLKPYGSLLDDLLYEEFLMPSPILEAKESLPPRLLVKKRNHLCEDELLAQLKRNNWNKSITARNLGISRGAINYHLKKMIGSTQEPKSTEVGDAGAA
ncbi:MAG: sigma-54-dependent Fis family transcriptional regulator [Fibrobacter sp.]|nr:sigma-54-dependent Fis family transcriptional regulator [Fibrobacter sp.]